MFTGSISALVTGYIGTERLYQFQGAAIRMAGYIEDYLRKHEITDLVLHGDQRLYHRLAIEKAVQLGVYVAVTELGALRPGWMTLERTGLSTLSHFPSDPAAIRRIAETAGPVDLSPRYPSSFWLQTAPDVVYNLTNVFLKPLYPCLISGTRPIPRSLNICAEQSGC